MLLLIHKGPRFMDKRALIGKELVAKSELEIE